MIKVDFKRSSPVSKSLMVLLISLFFMLFGMLIIVRGIETIFRPIPNMELAPLLLFASGTLFLFLGYYLPRFLKK